MTLKEVSVKEQCAAFWEHIGFEEGKGPKDVGRSMQDRRLINIRAILDVIDSRERKELFSGGENFLLYFLLIFLGCLLIIFILYVNIIVLTEIFSCGRRPRRWSLHSRPSFHSRAYLNRGDGGPTFISWKSQTYHSKSVASL